MSGLSSEFCTVQVLLGLENLSGLRNTGGFCISGVSIVHKHAFGTKRSVAMNKKEASQWHFVTVHFCVTWISCQLLTD